MLISRQARCIFVHVHKTGGTTVEALLRAHLPDLVRLGFKHDHAAWHRHAVPQWDDYFKFTFVRNPWDRLVSWHAMIRAQERRRRVFDRRKAKHPPIQLWNYVLRHGRRFEDFVLHCTEVIEDLHHGRKCVIWDQLDYLAGPDGTLLVDHVGRFENFAAELHAVLTRLGIDAGNVPHTNASRHTHYADYYTPALAAAVARRHARDIAAFGYRFASEPATR